MIYKIEIKKNNSLDVTSGAIAIKGASNYSRDQIKRLSVNSKFMVDYHDKATARMDMHSSYTACSFNI